MDQNLTTKEEIERLIHLGTSSRACLTLQVLTLKKRLDVPARIGGSLKSHPFGWLFGALASGLAGSMLLGRRRVAAPRKKRGGLISALLGLALTAARPLWKVWLTDQVKAYFLGRPLRPSQFRNPI